LRPVCVLLPVPPTATIQLIVLSLHDALPISNNYLGLATDERLKESAKDAVDSHGAGAGAVRTINGTLDLHLELEKKLAEFKGTEDRKSTRLNSSHVSISYAVFCLKKKRQNHK